MKRILLGLAAVVGLTCLAATPAMAHEAHHEWHRERPVRVERWHHPVYVAPPPVYVVPAPVYVQPAPVLAPTLVAPAPVCR